METIYGIVTDKNQFGVQAHSIDSKGNVVDSHFCSSEGFAKSDLGFSDPYMQKWSSDCDEEHSTVQFNHDRKEKYKEMFPDGFELKWIGIDIFETEYSELCAAFYNPTRRTRDKKLNYD